MTIIEITSENSSDWPGSLRNGFYFSDETGEMCGPYATYGDAETANQLYALTELRGQSLSHSQMTALEAIRQRAAEL